MIATDDLAYYRKREKEAMAKAEAATDPSIAAIHRELAARYHGMAIAAEYSRRRPSQSQAVG